MYGDTTLAIVPILPILCTCEKPDWPNDLSEVGQGDADLQYMLMAPYLT